MCRFGRCRYLRQVLSVHTPDAAGHGQHARAGAWPRVRVIDQKNRETGYGAESGMQRLPAAAIGETFVPPWTGRPVMAPAENNQVRSAMSEDPARPVSVP